MNAPSLLDDQVDEDQAVLERECASCGDIYAEHSFEGLAWCMESLWSVAFDAEPPRRVDTVVVTGGVL